MSELDRRTLIKRAAVIGGAAWTAPLILSTAADAASGGTRKCVPPTTVSGGEEFKQHTNGACGAGFYVNLGTLTCPCGGTANRYVSFAITADPTALNRARLYTSDASTGGGTTSVTFVQFTGNPTPEYFLYLAPVIGTQPESLLPGTYGVSACVFIRCCRAGYVTPAYSLQRVQFTVQVGVPCADTIQLGSTVVTVPNGSNACPSFTSINVC